MGRLDMVHLIWKVRCNRVGNKIDALAGVVGCEPRQELTVRVKDDEMAPRDKAGDICRRKMAIEYDLGLFSTRAQ